MIGSDKVHDLALLKIDAPDLQPVRWPTRARFAVGEKVYAIGNPFGLSGTMTHGHHQLHPLHPQRRRRAH